jgi:hypothetical protein
MHVTVYESESFFHGILRFSLSLRYKLQATQVPRTSVLTAAESEKNDLDSPTAGQPKSNYTTDTAISQDLPLRLFRDAQDR